MKELKNKVAVITGAASGIGLAMAERFAAEGMRVGLADVDEEALAEAQQRLAASGASTLALRTDVSKAADVEALAHETLETFGAVHVVCNNAGVGGDLAPTWEHTLENWTWVLGVNLWGVIHGIRTFVPIFLRQDTEAHVVNTASMAGLLSLPFGAVYHATKHAVVTISESLHHELALAGSKVGVSVLCPGFVRTNIMESGRHRPPELGVERPRLSEVEQAWREGYRALVDAGLPPAEVAGRVVDAIRRERFYVFPHPELLATVRERLETVLAQENPSLNLPDEMRLKLKV